MNGYEGLEYISFLLIGNLQMSMERKVSCIILILIHKLEINLTFSSFLVCGCL
jgi:hypothetical protein